jgi:hypothetical protein
VSWLLVVFVPGLLMLATFGLDRLESNLVGDAVSDKDVAAALDRAKADCARPPARDDVDDDLDADCVYEPFHTRFSESIPSTASHRAPARIYIHHRGNPEFLPTRQPDRV